MITISLPPVMDAQASIAVKSELIGRLEARSDVCCDAGMVDRVTTPALQLLLSAQQTFRSEGLQFSVCSQSQALSEALRLSGLDRLLTVNAQSDTENA